MCVITINVRPSKRLRYWVIGCLTVSISRFYSRATGEAGMNREEAPGKSPEDMYIQQKVRVLLMLKKMGSNVSVTCPFFQNLLFFAVLFLK